MSNTLPVGSMVSLGIKRSHQLVGVESRGLGSTRFRASGGGPVGSDSV